MCILSAKNRALPLSLYNAQDDTPPLKEHGIPHKKGGTPNENGGEFRHSRLERSEETPLGVRTFPVVVKILLEIYSWGCVVFRVIVRYKNVAPN